MLYYFQPHGVIRKMGSGEGVHEIDSGGKDYLYFKRLMIDEKFQGKGLGRSVLQEAKTFFKSEYPSISFIELMHYKDNEAGASLYEAAGYIATGEIRKTIRPGSETVYDEEIVRRCYVK